MKPTSPSPIRRLGTTLSAGLLLTLCGCALPGSRQSTTAADEGVAWSYVPDLPLSRAPFETVHANWKQRLDQAYVCIELEGTYTKTGARIPAVFEAMAAQGLTASGPPFALFYDDPGRVATEQLRSRACVPVSGPVTVSGPLLYDVVRSRTVVYALVAGAYPEVPRSYPGLYAFLETMGWVEDGPLREIYLVPPGSVASFDELMTEVQLPAAQAP